MVASLYEVGRACNLTGRKPPCNPDLIKLRQLSDLAERADPSREEAGGEGPV
jgi:pyrimidine deaminase RibD-like protein